MDFFRKAALKRIKMKAKASKEHVIMLVDDEEHNLTALSSLLRDDYDIITATDGDKGLELLKSYPNPERIHLIISDQRMPELSGVEFLQQTLDIIPKTKRILLTGFSDVDAIIDSINKGQIWRFVLKPYEPTEMLHIVRRALEVYDLETSNDRLVKELQVSLDKEKRLVQATSRFVPHDLLDLLEKKSITELQLGDFIKKDMAVMFSDVRGFTSLSERITPRESFDYINTYLSRVGPIVRKHSGFVVKYLGDGMMAVFSEGPEEAIRTGIEKLQAVRKLNEELEAQGQAAIRIGIGVNIGSMMLGIVGETDRMQGDVFADAVNLTARLEGLTKRYGVDFLITQETLESLEDREIFQYRPMGHVQVKGKKQPTSIYEIFDGDSPEQIALKNETKAEFEKGIERFHSGEFEESIQHFSAVAEQNPEDHATQYYIKRANTLLTRRASVHWSGFDLIESK